MSPSSILVVKPSSLGDIVHTLPSVHCLKRSFPEAQIRWIVNPEWKPLLEENRDLAEVIPFPRKSFRGLEGLPRFLGLGARLARLRPDLVLDFQGLLRSAWIARSARGKKILGLSDARKAHGCFTTRPPGFTRTSTPLTVTWSSPGLLAQTSRAAPCSACRKVE